MSGARMKFPDPGDCKQKYPAMLCPAERVIGLFNQENHASAKKISKNVRQWFSAEAHQRGWAGAHFLPEVQSHNGSGCVLARQPDVVDIQITVTEQTLVLVEPARD